MDHVGRIRQLLRINKTAGIPFVKKDIIERILFSVNAGKPPFLSGIQPACFVIRPDILSHIFLQRGKFFNFHFTALRGGKVIQLWVINEELEVPSQLGAVKFQLFIDFLHRLDKQQLIRCVTGHCHIFVLKDKFPKVIIDISEGGIHLRRIKFRR